MDKTECFQGVEGGDSSAASFMASVEESVSERESIDVCWRTEE